MVASTTASRGDEEGGVGPDMASSDAVELM
jgi:hypothetical protein